MIAAGEGKCTGKEKAWMMMLLEHAIQKRKDTNCRYNANAIGTLTLQREEQRESRPAIRTVSDDRKGSIDVPMYAAERKAHTRRYQYMHIAYDTTGREGARSYLGTVSGGGFDVWWY